MTRIFLLFSLIVVSQLCFAQVTTTPLLPVDNLPVTITFDATKGTAGLKDYVGDVFAHTGVITNKSTSATDWKYVIGTWGDNVHQPKLTRISGNTASTRRPAASMQSRSP